MLSAPLVKMLFSNDASYLSCFVNLARRPLPDRRGWQEPRPGEAVRSGQNL